MIEGGHDPVVDDYRALRLLRRFEERALDLWRAGEIVGSMHLSCGQEAIPVGACRALERARPFVPLPRASSA